MKGKHDTLVCPGAVPLQPLLLRRVAALVTRVLRVFGLSTAAPDELGFGNGFVPQLGAVLDTACAFCSKARDQAVAAGLSELRAAVLEKCDRAAEGFGRSGAAAASVEAALDALTGFRCELRKLARDDKAPAGKDLGRSLLAACDWCGAYGFSGFRASGLRMYCTSSHRYDKRNERNRRCCGTVVFIGQALFSSTRLRFAYPCHNGAFGSK